MIKAVIFDWGGVLIDYPKRDILSYCARALGVPYGKFAKIHCKYEDGFQKGIIPEGELWKMVCFDLGIASKPVSWERALRSAYFPQKGMFPLVSSLHKRYKTAILSNTEKPGVNISTSRVTACLTKKFSHASKGLGSLTRGFSG